MQTGEFIAFRTLSASNEPRPPTRKRFAPRSRQGCLTCRRRKVRCDQTRPLCERCAKARVGCVYQATDYSAPASNVGVPKTPSSPFDTSQQQIDLQFFIEVGSRNAGQWQCPSFFESLLPQFSQTDDCARYSLLALSTCIHQWHLRDDALRPTLSIRGTNYYSMACKQLLKADDGKASVESALVTSLALFFYDSFSDHMTRRYVHSNAAMSLLRQLSQGLSYNEISGWRSTSGKAGAQIVIEVAETYINEISYPVSLDGLNENIDKANTVPQSRSKLYVPIWLQFDMSALALCMKDGRHSNELVQAPSPEWTVVPVSPRSIPDCHTHLLLWHNWLNTWLINFPIPAQDLRHTQSLCQRWHAWLFNSIGPATNEMQSMQTRALLLAEMFQLKLIEVAAETNDVQPHIERILALIADNVVLAKQVLHAQSDSPSSPLSRYRQRQFLRGLPKVLDHVIRKTTDTRIRDRAYDLFVLQTRTNVR